MELNTRALSLTLGLLWAAALFLTGLAGLIWPGYGDRFLQIWASVYPGYDASGAFGDLIVGTLYALIDGAVVGLVFGWLYNLLVGKPKAV